MTLSWARRSTRVEILSFFDRTGLARAAAGLLWASVAVAAQLWHRPSRVALKAKSVAVNYRNSGCFAASDWACVKKLTGNILSAQPSSAP